MLMADTRAIFFVVLRFLLVLPALWLLCSGVWPDAVFKSHTKTSRNLIKPFLAGIPVTGAVLLIAVAMKNVFAGLGNIGAGVAGLPRHIENFPTVHPQPVELVARS